MAVFQNKNHYIKTGSYNTNNTRLNKCRITKEIYCLPPKNKLMNILYSPFHNAVIEQQFCWSHSYLSYEEIYICESGALQSSNLISFHILFVYHQNLFFNIFFYYKHIKYLPLPCSTYCIFYVQWNKKTNKLTFGYRCLLICPSVTFVMDVSQTDTVVRVICNCRLHVINQNLKYTTSILNSVFKLSF